MRAGTLVPATHPFGSPLFSRFHPLNEGRNFSSGNTSSADMSRLVELLTLNEGRNFSSGNTSASAGVPRANLRPLNEGRNFSSGNTPGRRPDGVQVRQRSMRAGTLVPATLDRTRRSRTPGRSLNEGRNFSSGNTGAGLRRPCARPFDAQ